MNIGVSIDCSSVLVVVVDGIRRTTSCIGFGETVGICGRQNLVDFSPAKL